MHDMRIATGWSAPLGSWKSTTYFLQYNTSCQPCVWCQSAKRGSFASSCGTVYGCHCGRLLMQYDSDDCGQDSA